MVSCFVFEGEPSGGSKQNCLAIYKPYNGWSDIGCIVNAYSICECTVEEDLDCKYEITHFSTLS